jgi:hypothetical protein
MTHKSGVYMRQSIQPLTLRFRASPGLAAEASARAAAAGMTFSELMRHALRRELQAAA